MQRRHLLLAATSLLAVPALAQPRSVRFIAGFPPGGLADVVARLVAGPLGEAIGATLVVENRTGASGTIAADAVAKSAPDGTTLAVSHAIPFGFAPGVLPSLTYDPVADFVHLGMLAEAPTVMVVTGRSPFRTLPELLEAARTRPVRYGSSGVGSAEHIMGAVVAREARATHLDHVPYRGTPPALQDLMAGQVDAINAPITTLVGQLRDGSLRALAVSTEARVAGFPDVPTLAELGYSRATMTQWIGVSAPRGLPPAMAERIAAAIPGIVARPEIAARLEELASPPRQPLLTGEAFQRFVGGFRDHWVAIARAENIVAS
ncbi:Bug family tripartite tricarboxylate transporter substrate binding protein [Falsiroseomonas oryziterrae]|uniref:Bug family tripartite tricarboxylate transporter substrate binding protein n=1 Tax=Falsiroseomonas oryziterrae TaxID=2911368 RepID=UPI001F31E4B6|nr:tripartite tricarboxylate transporter substrate binding protein [Roseomonas sp. NPKOSM-4]